MGDGGARSCGDGWEYVRCVDKWLRGVDQLEILVMSEPPKIFSEMEPFKLNQLNGFNSFCWNRDAASFFTNYGVFDFVTWKSVSDVEYVVFRLYYS